MRNLRLLLIPAVLSLATACSDDSSSGSDEKADDTKPAGATSAPTEEYDPQAYCDITRQLEQAGEEAFADLDRDSTDAEYEAAERSFIVDNEGLLDDLVAAAPPHLTDEVETFLAAMRQRGGLEDSGVTQREASQAEEQILAWEKKNC